MNPPISHTNRILVIGAVHLDDIAQPEGPLVSRASNPVTWTQRIGGVAANAACAAARILPHSKEATVEIAAAVGDDATARQLKQALHDAGVGTRLSEFPATSTGRYTAVMTGEGELHIGLADVSLAERLGESDLQIINELDAYKAVLVDANLSEYYLTAIANQTQKLDVSLAAMSVSPVKSRRMLSVATKIDVLFCNRREAQSMNPLLPINASLEALADGLCLAGFTQLVLTDGNSPLLVQDKLHRVYLTVPDVESTQNVNGAGDALAGASFAAWTTGMNLIEAVRDIGLVEAAMVVSGDHTAPRINSAVSR